jgi:hypothetical protein
VQHFNSTRIHCDYCTVQNRRDGSLHYQHSALAAVMVHPAQKEVMSLDFEPIICQDGSEKNDCEQVAAKRLNQSLKEKYPDTLMILVEDALYANAPNVREIRANGWHYIISVKPESHKSLFKQFEYKRANGKVKTLETKDERGRIGRYSWVEGLYLCQRATDFKVNCLWYEEENAKGQITQWCWATSLPLEARTVEKVMKAGRSRWKIENETFNTLKNQGYHFEHNYGHGEKNLASVLALLMMLAFLVDQIQERCCELFKHLRSGLQTRAKLWESLRSIFKVISLPSMSSLYVRMAGLYEIQLK